MFTNVFCHVFTFLTFFKHFLNVLYINGIECSGCSALYAYPYTSVRARAPAVTSLLLQH